jgi:hypothetical protein
MSDALPRQPSIRQWLDEHADRVLRLKHEGATLAQICADAESLGRKVTIQALSIWFKRREREQMRRAWEDRVINALRDNNERMSSVAKASGESGMAAVMVGLEKVALQLSVMLSGDASGIKFDGVDVEGVTEQLQVIAATIKPILEYRKVLVQERQGALDERRMEEQTVDKFLKWYGDHRTRAVAESALPNEEKIRRLRTLFFADVEAAERALGDQIPGGPARAGAAPASR